MGAPRLRLPAPAGLLIAAAALLALAAGASVDAGTPQAGAGDRVATDAATAEPDPVSHPDEFATVGEAMTAKLCYTDCHGSDRVFSIRRTAEDWDILIRDMAGRGVVGTKAQIGLVRRYLTWSFGRIAVNTAPADELAAVAGIAASDAATIVAYRDDHGPFTDIDALLKVPGLAPATIEAIGAQVYALYFD